MTRNCNSFKHHQPKNANQWWQHFVSKVIQINENYRRIWPEIVLNNEEIYRFTSIISKIYEA